ncbi:PilW family protein [Halomonas sp. E19]|uniref:PilW family protein n=1 Tax=Halomonas sp. E19 TaxID=3397247 RepID=UPI0040336999
MRDPNPMLPLAAPTNASSQAGFTLVELMVALVIGLIIILGAGQLFLMGFQTFRDIEELSKKQAALTFVTETLIRDVRRANLSVPCGAGEGFAFSVDGSCHIYTVENGVLSLSVDDDKQPIVEGVLGLERFDGSSGGCDAPGLYCIDIQLEGELDSLRFHAMNRSVAVAGN